MKSSLKAVVGIAATVFFLWLALRNVEWREVASHLREANWLLLGAAVLVSTLGMHVRAMRWKPLLEPVAPGVPFRARIAGVFIGFGANNVFPARLGEFARTWVLAREARVPLTGAFASLVLERALDGMVMIVFLLISMSMPGFPEIGSGGDNVRMAVRVVTAVTAAALLLLLCMAFLPARTVRLVERMARLLPLAFRRPLVDAMHAFLGGLHVLRNPRLLAVSVAWAVFQWTFLAGSFVLAFRAFGIDEPGFLGAVFLQSVIAVAVSLPAGPGFFGPFEAASVWGLGLWGVDASRAASFAIGFHLGGWLTVTLGGVYYAARLKLRWSDLGRVEETVEQAVEEDLDVDAKPA
ncbi:MAG: flippase-like domain-containing protein [Gemmatimonadetes bacterium]|nr:flippase-like domain-containing protein [Gemmatimonadota bacterium]